MKHQKPHKNKYEKKSSAQANQDRFDHFTKRSKNYYGNKKPGKKT